MSDESAGLSIFYSLAERVAPHGVYRSRAAFLSADDLQGVSTMIIASALVDVSSHEAKLIKSFVEDGGLLVLSFHDDSSRVALDDLLHELDIKSDVAADNEFENGTHRRIKAHHESIVASTDSLLGLYSAELFDVPDCQTDRFSCYVKEKAVGKGKVVLFNGIIPIANGLIGKEENRWLAFNLVHAATGKIVIDEYRHLFTDKTFGDLLSDFRVILPLAVLFLGALAFFLLGDREEQLHEKLFEDVTRVPIYHDFAKRVFLGSIEGKWGLAQAAEFNARCIEESFPDRRDFVSQAALKGRDPESRLRSTIKAHRAILLERGVIKGTV